jgi:phage terminase large subunit
MLQATTALRKISTLRNRIRGIQGGQGASKTYSILMILINHASSNANKEIFIASDELSKMRITVIKDFCKIMIAFGIYERDRFTDGTMYRFRNGSFIKFIGLDKVDIGKGLRSDVMFVNEANKVKFDTYRELTSRAKNVYIDFNPNKRFWFHTEVATRDDCDFIKLTFKDNEFLSQEEKNEILRYKDKGYVKDEVGNFAVNDKGDLVILNQYWANMWRVYGEGEVGQVEGRIYNWHPIANEDYAKINKEEIIGNDWGKVDPWAIAGLKYHDGNLYVDEKHYESENEIERSIPQAQLQAIRGSETVGSDGERHDGLVSWRFKQLGIGYNQKIVCDNNRPNKIRSLRHAGWEYAVAVGGKSDLDDRIGILSGLNIFYTQRSKNIEYEQENYAYDKDKFGQLLESPIDQDNHLIDGIAYGVSYMFKTGIIKNI